MFGNNRKTTTTVTNLQKLIVSINEQYIKELYVFLYKQLSQN